jgi:DNA-binding MarR family transcriptional regulator
MQPVMARIDAAKVWSLNYRLVSEVIVSVAPQLAEFDLEPKEIFILAAIYEHPHPEAIADTLCMPKPTVTLYLKRLEAANFVRREIDPRDLRRHKLNLTAAGRKVTVRGLALLSEAYAARLSRLNAAEQAQLVALLEKLG